MANLGQGKSRIFLCPLGEQHLPATAALETSGFVEFGSVPYERAIAPNKECF